jgi:hypothetical protein
MGTNRKEPFVKIRGDSWENTMDLEAAAKLRDRRLRRRVLNALQLSLSQSPSGELSGRTLMEVINPIMGPGSRFEGEEHCLRICREMVAKGYCTERDARTHPKRQPFGLPWLTYKITDKGIALWNESAGPDGDVEDDRVEE